MRLRNAAPSFACQEDFPQSSVFILSCPDIELVPAYRGFLGIACPAIRRVPMCSSGRYELARLGGEGVSIGILVISGWANIFVVIPWLSGLF